MIKFGNLKNKFFDYSKASSYTILSYTVADARFLKSIHFVNSSAQGSCFHKITADVSSG